MREGWGLSGSGALCVIGGVMLALDGPFAVGFGIALIGVVALICGIALAAEGRWPDSVDEEVDRWERNWTSTWTPECPVHGLNLCVIRTRRCPMTRDRTGV